MFWLEHLLWSKIRACTLTYKFTSNSLPMLILINKNRDDCRPKQHSKENFFSTNFIRKVRQSLSFNVRQNRRQDVLSSRNINPILKASLLSSLVQPYHSNFFINFIILYIGYIRTCDGKLDYIYWKLLRKFSYQFARISLAVTVSRDYHYTVFLRKRQFLPKLWQTLYVILKLNLCL